MLKGYLRGATKRPVHQINDKKIDSKQKLERFLEELVDRRIAFVILKCNNQSSKFFLRYFSFSKKPRLKTTPKD